MIKLLIIALALITAGCFHSEDSTLPEPPTPPVADDEPEQPIVIEDEVLGYGEFVAHCKPYVQNDTYSDMKWSESYGRYPGYQTSCEKTCQLSFDTTDAITGESLRPPSRLNGVDSHPAVILSGGETRIFTLTAGFYFGGILRIFNNCTGLPVSCQDGTCNTRFGYSASDSFNILDGGTYTGEY